MRNTFQKEFTDNGIFPLAEHLPAVEIFIHGPFPIIQGTGFNIILALMLHIQVWYPYTEIKIEAHEKEYFFCRLIIPGHSLQQGKKYG